MFSTVAKQSPSTPLPNQKEDSVNYVFFASMPSSQKSYSNIGRAY